MSFTRGHDPAPNRGLERNPEEAAAARGANRGEPLPSSVRQQLEPRLGADFSDVRIHTDAAAGHSALALGARAYSLGPDIVFAPGHYAPATSTGHELLAHELAHVKQDGGRRPGADERVSIDAPDSAQEREAEGAGRSAVTGAHVAGTAAPAPAAASRHGGATLHRSVLGSVLGGVIGSVGLGVLGGMLFGPAGAVIGAIGGLIGGAIVGDLASRQSRSLTQPEKDYLKEIYHDAVDFERVTITRGSALSAGAARTVGNTINLQDEHFKGDTMELSDAGKLVLAHEMGHVWQYQNGGLSYIPSSLIPQIVAGLSGKSRNLAYDWRSAVRNHIDWSEWNAEQQAECISDYNEAFRRIEAGTNTLDDYDTVTLAQPFIELVRQRIGAPGSDRKRPAASPAPAGGTP